MKVSVEGLNLALINHNQKKNNIKHGQHFFNQILKVANKELATYSNITCTYTRNKIGRKYTDIAFQIMKKSV